MAMITHLVSPEELDREEVLVEGDAYRHLFRARRLARGARLRLVDGKGRARWAVVETVERRLARLLPGEPAESREPAYALDLWVAALRPERAAWLVEKATEVGVASIRFYGSQRTPRSYGDGNLERWRRMARSAVEQCHRARCPEISGVASWQELEAAVARQGAKGHDLLLLDAAGRPAADLPAPRHAGLVVVGPEGGLDSEEIRRLLELGLVAFSLGERVLRVETAAIIAAAWPLLLARPTS